MNQVKYPCVAGYFYPEDKAVLQQTLSQFLSSAKPLALAMPPKAMIAPHAGYQYSGVIAANIYAYLEKVKHVVKKVVLLGPAHRVPFRGIAATEVTYFETPLGQLAVDTDSMKKVIQFPHVQFFEKAYEQEHALEVHLPFIQHCLNDVSIIPLLVGDAPYSLVSDVLETLWGGDETLIIISSDLSHFYEYDMANKMDAAASKAIVELKPDALDYEHACGRIPVQGLLVSAKKHQLTAHMIDVRNSGDTAGNKDRVVGYGAYHFG